VSAPRRRSKDGRQPVRALPLSRLLEAKKGPSAHRDGLLHDPATRPAIQSLVVARLKGEVARHFRPAGRLRDGRRGRPSTADATGQETDAQSKPT
jgi:hypothetical protein